MSKSLQFVTLASSVLAMLVAIASAAYFIGGLESRVKTLQEESIGPALETALTEIEKRKTEVLNELRNALPPKLIIASYARTTNAPDGWVVCDGNDGTPNMRERFLIGTTDLQHIGSNVGAKAHDHSVDLKTTGERDGKFQKGAANTPDDFADNIHKGVGKTGPRNWFHLHRAIGKTKYNKELPPSVKVLFFCKKSNRNLQ